MTTTRFELLLLSSRRYHCATVLAIADMGKHIKVTKAKTCTSKMLAREESCLATFKCNGKQIFVYSSNKCAL